MPFAIAKDFLGKQIKNHKVKRERKPLGIENMEKVENSGMRKAMEKSHG